MNRDLYGQWLKIYNQLDRTSGSGSVGVTAALLMLVAVVQRVADALDRRDA